MEPSGVYRADGKRLDGISVVPWKNGKLLVWDVTCTDTSAPLYIASATSNAAAVVALAKERKLTLYGNLVPTTKPFLCASEVIGPKSSLFLKVLGHCIKLSTGEARYATFLLQHLSITVQRGNAASVLGNISLS